MGLQYLQANQEHAFSHLTGERCEELCEVPECEETMQQSNSSNVVTKFHHIRGLQEFILKMQMFQNIKRGAITGFLMEIS